MWKRIVMINLCFILGVGVAFSGAFVSQAAEGLSLYTPYTGISATPGETIDYSVEVINNTNAIRTVEFEVRDLPEAWEDQLTSGGRTVQQLSVKPDDSEDVRLEVQVPLEVEKDTYTFNLHAKGDVSSTLPLTVRITEEGTAASELSIEQPNLQGDASSTFDFKATVRNRTAEEQNYALMADAPRGWVANFKVDGNNVTSVTVEENSTKDIDISVIPPEKVKADTYTIPIRVATGSTNLDESLEAVITGTHSIKLGTTSDRLSTEVTAGGKKTIEMEIINTGSAPVSDISLSADTPTDWEVDFEPAKVNKLEAGQSEKVKATVSAASEAIAGDYVTTMKAESPDASSEANIRVSVKTSLMWGFIGILVIVVVIGGVLYLIRTYGRR